MTPKCNILKGICELKFPTGYYRCYHCEGIGFHPKYMSLKQRQIKGYSCETCNGLGYVDWITYSRKIKIYQIQHYFPNIDITTKCPKDNSCKVMKRWIKNIKKSLATERKINEYFIDTD